MKKFIPRLSPRTKKVLTTVSRGFWALVFIAVLAFAVSAAIDHSKTSTQKGTDVSGVHLTYVKQLTRDNAQQLFMPDANNLKPHIVVIEFCQPSAFECQLQLAQDDQVAEALKGQVDFYLVDPSADPALYNALYQMMVQQAGQHIPQAFPMRTLWMVQYAFSGTTPQAQLGLVNLNEDLTPAGGIVQWISQSLSGGQQSSGSQSSNGSAAPSTDGSSTPSTDTSTPKATPTK